MNSSAHVRVCWGKKKERAKEREVKGKGKRFRGTKKKCKTRKRESGQSRKKRIWHMEGGGINEIV